MRLEFTIKNWDFVSRERAEKVFEIMGTDGKWEIRKATTKRSLNQNAYLHALFTRIAEDIWEEPDYIKYHFKKQFLKKFSIKKNIEYIWETSKLDTVAFWEFVDKVLNEMAKFGYNYPTPDEYKAWADFNN